LGPRSRGEESSYRLFRRSLHGLRRMRTRPLTEVARKQTLNVAGDFSPGYCTPALQKPLVGFAKRSGTNSTGMPPLVNQLFEYARIRMLIDEAGSEQLEAFAGDRRNQRRIVQEPPAAEWH